MKLNRTLQLNSEMRWNIMGKKEHLGFDTPAIALQDEIKKLGELIDVKKTEWSELRDWAKAGFKEIREQNEGKLLAHEPFLLQWLGVQTTFFFTLTQIGELGMHISDVENRLVDIEKILKGIAGRFK